MSEEKTLPDQFLDYVESMINESGVYPHPALVLNEDGSLRMMALDVDVKTWARQFWNYVQGTHGQAAEIIFGLDMETRPLQGTEFRDALVFVYWKHDPGKKLADPSCFKTGVINYQHEPRIVRPIDWNNSHWQHWMKSWIGANQPPFLVRTVKG